MRCPAASPVLALAAITALALAACNSGRKDADVHPEPKATAAPGPAPAPAPSPTDEGALRLGAPIEASVEKVALTDVAKNPSAFVGKKFTTTGTVTAVCQHKGCWMEIKDDTGEAHIKMAGHAFFVPKTASGHKARILATLVKNEAEGACSEEGMATAGGAAASPAKDANAKESGKDAKDGAKKGCRAEAEAQLGRPLAKLELIAEGVELM